MRTKRKEPEKSEFIIIKLHNTDTNRITPVQVSAQLHIATILKFRDLCEGWKKVTEWDDEKDILSVSLSNLQVFKVLELLPLWADLEDMNRFKL